MKLDFPGQDDSPSYRGVLRIFQRECFKIGYRPCADPEKPEGGGTHDNISFPKKGAGWGIPYTTNISDKQANQKTKQNKQKHAYIPRHVLELLTN